MTEIEANGFTVEDWLAWDGAGDQRVELIDGSLVVHPAPLPRHQRILHRLKRLIDDPLAEYGLTGDVTGRGVASMTMRPEQGLIPDVLVVPSDVDIDELTVMDATDVVLIVEVVSSSSDHWDRVRKLEIYAGMGIPHYWLIDPGLQVTITTLLLDGGAYRQGAHASGDEPLQIDQPLHVTLTPSQLAVKEEPPQD